MPQTLEELRAENAAADAALTPVPQTGVDDADDTAAADPNADVSLAEGEEGEEGQQAEPEAWMTGDDQESPGAQKKFTDKDIGAAKAGLRARLEKQHQTELDQMRAQLEELRSKSVVQQPTSKPKREQFYDQDDPDEAYMEALSDWKLNERLATQQLGQQQYEQQRKQLEAQQRISSNVDQHYERAAVLAAASGITPELYQSADLRVRSAIEGVFPGGGGETVTNALIASLGEGSEKVFYKLGVSPKSLAELTSKLAQDPSGIQASIYLGRLSAELTTTARKRSNTPAPATNVQGDANTTDLSRALLRRYQEAHKRGDTQAAYDIRTEAKAKKINVNSW
jgi:hypothetical protein